MSEQFYLVERKPSDYSDELKEFEEFIESLEVD